MVSAYSRCVRRLRSEATVREGRRPELLLSDVPGRGVWRAGKEGYALFVSTRIEGRRRARVGEGDGGTGIR